MPTAYIASPYGFSVATRRFYDRELLPAVRAAGIEPHDPWADADGETARAFAGAYAMTAGPERHATFAAINARLGAANADLIRGCDAVLAILDGVDVDSGTAAEIGYAAALGKSVVGLRLDIRQSGDNEATVVNLQVEHFLTAITRDLDAAVRALSAAVAAAR